MTHKIRGVDAEKYAYYVNKLRLNIGLEIWIWREIVTSQVAHTKYKWPQYVTEWNHSMKIFCVRHCLPWFAHASQLINLIDIGPHCEIRGSVLPGFKGHNAFLFQVVTCSCHITLYLLPSVVCTSQSTPAQRMFVHFARLSPCAKTQSVMLTHFFVAQTVTIGKQRISQKSDLKK